MNDKPNDKRRPSSFEQKGSELMPMVYAELRKRAAVSLHGIQAQQTLQPTELVHEAFLKLEKQTKTWESEEHFLAVATLAVRQVVVDRIRAKHTSQRGEGQRPVSLDWDLPVATPAARDDVILAVDASIEELRLEDPRAADVVVFRFFLGMTIEQCAAVLRVNEKTVRRDWLFAKTWLASRDALSDAWGQGS